VSWVAALLVCLLLLLLPRLLLSPLVRRRTRSLPYPAGSRTGKGANSVRLID
jgi:hypothetical protein